MRPRPSLGLPVLAAAALLPAQTPVVSWAHETMRLAAASVVPAGNGFDVSLLMADDNGNTALPTSWRRWWHCEIGNLDPAGTQLTVTVDSLGGYTDTILPVWSASADGVTFGPYTRCPLSAVPAVLSGGRHRFALVTPPGATAIRLAKYFPWSVARKDALLQSLAGDPRVRSIATIGTSVLGRPIQRIELTDGTVPDAGKVRVWIHAGIHPAETTSYFTVEGLIAWLRSADPLAAALLDRAILDVVPMANPDGVALGNYRTNANSVNLEDEWAAPYASTQPEIVALRTRIEQAMGTVAAPGANPIEVLLNLHASHNIAFPFHFQHTANASWTPGASGVIPLVHQLEGQWIAAFAARSPFVALGTTLSSSAGFPSRPFVESMMHDRWTAVNGWLNAPGLQQPVMAITFEGTYGRGPDGVSWNTEADWRQCGAELGRALADHLGVTLTASLSAFGHTCTTAQLSGTLAPQPGGAHLATLTLVGAPPRALGWLVLGFQQVQVPLPPPWANCDVLVSTFGTATFGTDFLGIAQFPLLFPAWPGLVAHLQTITADLSLAPNIPLDTSNGVTIRNHY